LGSSDGFMRALNVLIGDKLEDRTYLLFGFGKVGVGIAWRLSSLRNNRVIVVDSRPSAIMKAMKLGYEAISSDNKEKVEAAAREAFCIITATGIPGIISNLYK
jgi:adenosylhomocysteinase